MAYYYWFDTEHAVLYRGEMDEEGNELRDAEQAVLWDIYERAGANPNPETGEEELESWDKIDHYIEKQLGFLPEYDVN